MAPIADNDLSETIAGASGDKTLAMLDDYVQWKDEQTSRPELKAKQQRLRKKLRNRSTH
jgi:hypothetical protein